MAEEIVPLNTEEKVTFFKKRSTNKNLRKRKAESKSKDSDEDFNSEEDDNVSSVVTKARKTGLNPFVQSTQKRRVKKGDDDEEEDKEEFGNRYTADRSAQIKKDDATRYDTEWELEKKELDSRKKIAPKKEVLNSKMSVGPQRAPANLRVTARFDYQPDVCKDYKGNGRKT
ncbi:hypothetical protein G6F56_010507 [Rhizopus delemar]|nr:hypothetical protein G6F56_010507 [Rhizopus delemar]